MVNMICVHLKYVAKLVFLHEICVFMRDIYLQSYANNHVR